VDLVDVVTPPYNVRPRDEPSMHDLNPPPDPAECLAGGGQMGALMRRTDWAKTARR
jgi:hypothetical protein